MFYVLIITTSNITKRFCNLDKLPFVRFSLNHNTRLYFPSQDRQALTIFRVQKSDAGTYQCNASNVIGWDTMKYTVRVRGGLFSLAKIVLRNYRSLIVK